MCSKGKESIHDMVGLHLLRNLVEILFQWPLAVQQNLNPVGS